MDDTTPEIAEKVREMFRKKSPSERLNMGSSMNAMLRFLITRAILEKNPNISKAGLRQELFFSYQSLLCCFDGAADEKTFDFQAMF